MIKPWWWKGTPDEWEKISSDDQKNLNLLSGAARDERMRELIATVKGIVYNPQSVKAKMPQEATSVEQVALKGLRNWKESVDGIPAARIRDCIVFLLDVKRDPWYISNCNNRAFVERNAAKMNACVPEDYHWEPNPLVGWRTKYIDDQAVLQTFIARDPKTEEERRKIWNQFDIGDSTIPYIADPTCEACHGKGYVYVSSYPDDPLRVKIEESYYCPCLKRFEKLPTPSAK